MFHNFVLTTYIFLSDDVGSKVLIRLESVRGNISLS